MYPHQELVRLAAHKARLVAVIAGQREAFAANATRASRPLAALDRLLVLWRGLAPVVKFAAVPASFFLLRSVAPRWKSLRHLLRWLPPALATFRTART